MVGRLARIMFIAALLIPVTIARTQPRSGPLPALVPISASASTVHRIRAHVRPTRRFADGGTQPDGPAQHKARPLLHRSMHTAEQVGQAGQSSLCTDPFALRNGTTSYVGNRFVYWAFDFDLAQSSGSPLGFPGDLYFDPSGQCNYSYTNIEGSIALSFVENGVRYVYGTPNGEFGDWLTHSPTIPQGTVTGLMAPTAITQDSAPGQSPLVVTFSFLAGDARVDWTLSIGDTSLSTPYSINVTAPGTTPISDVSLYHLYDLDDLHGGDSSPDGDGKYQNGQIGSVNSLLQGIGIGGYNANWDLSLEDGNQQDPNDTFQKVVTGAAFNNYPEGQELATNGQGADGGLQFLIGTLAAGASATVGGSGGGTRTYLIPPAPNHAANDENFVAINPSAVPATSASLGVTITRFFGALAADTGITGLPAPGQLSLHALGFVESASGMTAAVTLQVEAYNIADQGGTVHICTSASDPSTCADITATGSWQADRNAPGWSTFTSNTVPASFLNFPNLDLSSTTAINPPQPASNYVTVTSNSGSTAIAWARIQALGVRPVILVHGIAKSRTGIPSASQDPSDLSGWGTWQNWVTAYLPSIGVPNTRPSEDVVAMSETTPGTSDPSNLGQFVSDARVYVSAFGSYQDNASIVNKHIAMVLQRYGVDKVNVVTHSFGGLDGLYASKSDQRAIAHLVMLAVPYEGTPLADFILGAGITTDGVLDGIPVVGEVAALALAYKLGEFSPGLEQLSTFDFLRDIDLADLNPSTLYETEAGTRSQGVVDALQFVFTFAGVNDGAVPLSSVTAVPGAQYLGPYKYNHLEINQNPEPFAGARDSLSLHSLGQEYSGYGLGPQSNTAQPLDDANSGLSKKVVPNGVTTGSPAVTAAPSQTFGPALTGQLTAQNTMTERISVPHSSTLNSLLAWDQGTLQMTLIDPKGQVITPLSAGGQYTQTLNAGGGDNLVYALNAPASGIWTAVITNTATSGPAATFLLATSFVSSLTMSPSQALLYQQGASIPLTVNLADGGAAIAGATITATASLAGSNPVTITLADHGNGTYDGNFGALTTPGEYTVNLVATGRDSGAPFAITGLSFFTVSTGNASFAGTYAEGTTNGDFGFISALNITPTIQVNTSGNYSLRGTLTDAAGDVVGTAGTDAYLSSGTSQGFGLSFDGATIGATGKDGPYQLRNLTLTDDSTGAVMTDDQLPQAYTTASYVTSEFARPLVQILPGTQDYGSNPDATGRFQNLTLAFTASVALNDSYQVVATLTSPQGRYITQVAQTVQLSSAPTRVSLQFSGGDIAAAGIDGPYDISGVTIVPASSPATYASYPAFWVTQPYQAAQFALPPATPTPTNIATSTPTPTNTAMPMPSNIPMSLPTLPPTSIPVMAPPTATLVPLSPPTSTPLATAIPVLPTSTPPVSTTATTVVAVPSALPAPTVQPLPIPALGVPSFKVYLSALHVQSGRMLRVFVRTGPRARVAVVLQVVTTRTVLVGKGRQRHRVRQTVVLYRLVSQGVAGAQGRLLRVIQVAYPTARSVRATLTVTTLAGRQRMVHTATVTIDPRAATLVVVASPRSVAGGGMLTLRIRTTPHGQVSITLRVVGQKVTVTGTSRKRHRVVHPVMLYQLGVHGVADARGLLTVRLHVGFHPARLVRATLTVAAHGPSTTASVSVPVVVAPR